MHICSSTLWQFSQRLFRGPTLILCHICAITVDGRWIYHHITAYILNLSPINLLCHLRRLPARTKAKKKKSFTIVFGICQSVRVVSSNWQIHVVSTPHSPYKPDNGEFTIYGSETHASMEVRNQASASSWSSFENQRKAHRRVSSSVTISSRFIQHQFNYTKKLFT
jgi:hypothetical protein